MTEGSSREMWLCDICLGGFEPSYSAFQIDPLASSPAYFYVLSLGIIAHVQWRACDMATAYPLSVCTLVNVT